MLTLLAALLLGPALSFAKEAPSPVVVAVIDTGYTKFEAIPVCKGGLVDFTGSGTYDSSDRKHGSNVAGLIAREAGSTGYCLVLIKVFYIYKGNIVFDVSAYYKALSLVARLKPAVVNLSITGLSVLEREHDLILKILDAGTLVIASSGNEKLDLNKTGCIVYPACVSPRVIMVANSEGGSNVGTYVDAYENGTNQRAGGTTLTGSSQAAAVHTGKLVRRLVRAKMGH